MTKKIKLLDKVPPRIDAEKIAKALGATHIPSPTKKSSGMFIPIIPIPQRIDFKNKGQIEALFGAYNDYPPGWREITEKEFVQSKFFQSLIEHQDHRQMLHRNKDGSFKSGMLEVELFFFHDGTGVAMGHKYYEGTLQFYAFGLCEHPPWSEVFELAYDVDAPGIA